MHVTNLSVHIRGESSQVFNGEEACFDQLVVLLSQCIHKLALSAIQMNVLLAASELGWRSKRQ